MLSKFKKFRYLRFIFVKAITYFYNAYIYGSAIPNCISYLLAWITILIASIDLNSTIKFNSYTLLFSVKIGVLNMIFYHLLVARHKSLRSAKLKSGWTIFFNHIKAFFIIYLAASAYFRNFLLVQWPVDWRGIIFSIGNLTLTTGILRFLVKRKMGKWYPDRITK
jgi:hypothetical protein